MFTDEQMRALTDADIKFKSLPKSQQAEQIMEIITAGFNAALAKMAKDYPNETFKLWYKNGVVEFEMD